jgi:hypothetical protein
VLNSDVLYEHNCFIFGVTKFGSGGCFPLNEREEKDFTVSYISKSYIPMNQYTKFNRYEKCNLRMGKLRPSYFM